MNPPSAFAPRPRVGLALAGGGPLGMIYEIGTLRALEEAVDGLHLTDLDVYVGVSAGAVVAASLANGIGTEAMGRILVRNDSPEHAINPERFMLPAFGEYARRLATLPRLTLEAMARWLRDPLDRGLMEAIAHLGKALPTGLFDSEAVHQSLSELFDRPGRSNDFRQLAHKLFVVAVDLDTGRSVRFGEPGFDHVPISRAVQASAALPGFYPPVRIDGRHYVDGALQRTLHASLGLDQGVDVMLCVNPIVPLDRERAASRGEFHGSLINGGLPAVISQSLRALIHSRLKVGMAKYEGLYDSDVLLFEPDSGDTALFFSNPFSFANRRRLCEHAYQATRRDLLARFDTLAPLLARHGLTLRKPVLVDRERTFDQGLEQRRRPRHSVIAQLDETLDALTRALPRTRP